MYIIGNLLGQLLLALLVAVFLPTESGAVGVEGLITFQNNRILGPSIGGVDGNKYYSGFDLEYRDRKNRSFKRNFDFSSRLTDTDEFVYSVSEANLEWNWSRDQVTVGRKVLRWSDLDEIWGYGHVNNRQNFTLYEPGLEGLTGIFYTKEFNDAFRLSIFGSYFYVPELNPGTTVVDGKVTTKSPWTTPPPETTDFEGSTVPMYYTLNMPRTEDVVFRYSFGLNAEYVTDFMSMNAFAIRKPENTPRLFAIGEYVPDKGVAEAIITPHFVHETIVGGTIAKLYQDYRFYLSTLNVYPDPMGIEKDPNKTQYVEDRSRKHFVGFGANKTGDAVSLGIGYIQLINPLGEDDGRNKQKFRKAVDLNANLMAFKRIKFEFDYKYDLETGDQIVKHETSFRVEKDVSIAAGFKLIAATDDDSFWAQYRDRDMAYTSLTYYY